MRPERKDIALLVVFTLLTCGIYYWYWMYCTSSDIQQFTGGDSISPGMEVLFSILTCGIYGWYWMYKYNKKLQTIPRSCEIGDNTVLCVIFAVLELTVVSAAIMQSDLNKIWENNARA